MGVEGGVEQDEPLGFIWAKQNKTEHRIAMQLSFRFLFRRKWYKSIQFEHHLLTSWTASAAVCTSSSRSVLVVTVEAVEVFVVSFSAWIDIPWNRDLLAIFNSYVWFLVTWLLSCSLASFHLVHFVCLSSSHQRLFSLPVSCFLSATLPSQPIWETSHPTSPHPF